MWWSRVVALILSIVAIATMLSGCGASGASSTPSGGKALTLGITSVVASKPFDPSVGAPLPYNRIVAAYGIVGGTDFNGPASTLDLLNSFLPQLQSLGKQYATLDPTHPVKLGIDLVVNVIQPCASFARWCASATDDATIQAYVTFCKQHDLLLFFDMQFGVEPVSTAVTEQVQKYLEQYPFTELALDTEFHFPNTPQGYAEAAGYPCCLGSMDAAEINWAINDLAQISLKHHLPRKVLVVHQWAPSVISNKDRIAHNPNVSIVIQSDGWGYLSNKLGDYQIFVQQDLVEYGGYKLFLQYPGDNQYDMPLQTPADVLQLFPQPLFVSYQ